VVVLVVVVVEFAIDFIVCSSMPSRDSRDIETVIFAFINDHVMSIARRFIFSHVLIDRLMMESKSHMTNDGVSSLSVHTHVIRQGVFSVLTIIVTFMAGH
jgi:hypothetical protein